MFIDEVTLKIIAGKGGDGCTSFRHEKFVEMGGPDGGNGGKGGNIIFKGDEGLKTLIDLRYKKLIKGNKGENGKGSNRTGAKGEDVIIKVPVGTTVTDEETGLIICDITKDKEEFIIATGGRGGKGNAAFKTNENKAPLTSEYGLPGEERTIKCELKLLADVGLVGLPSVGKSSIINTISRANAKVASYHFTTLSPNLGVVKVNDKSFVVADLPGLIEGASEGVGLGDKFLKHAMRTKVIAHVVDMSGIEYDPYESYIKVENELKKYNENLYNKPRIIIANKMDISSSKENLEEFSKKIKNIEIIPISTVTKENVDKLKYKLLDLVEKHKDSSTYENLEFENYVLYEFKNEKPYEIEKESENTWVIKGKKLEDLLRMTKFNSDEATLKFARKLKRMGVDEKLKELGAKEGDIVKILDFEFEYEERLKY